MKTCNRQTDQPVPPVAGQDSSLVDRNFDRGCIFSPYFILGDGCIFEINDQLDESIMNYMLPARHLWDGSTVYPEMLGGVNASGMQPSAILFLPLYCLFSARVAFLTQYMICFVLAFLGMYLLVKESTESSIWR